MMIELPNLEHGADGLRFALAGAFADPERLVDGRQLHVRLVTAVVKKVDPTNRADNPTRPGLLLATKQGGRALAGQLFSQTATQEGILFVELLPAELVRHCDNQFKNRADFHRTLARCFAFCHFLPSLVLVRAPMGQPEPELLVLNDALLPHDITPKHSIRFSFVEPVGSNNRLSLPDEQSAKLILAEIG